MADRVVIIGGGQAGGRTAQILANANRDLHITLIGAEPHPPYNRPPLSKGVLLGTADFAECAIWDDNQSFRNAIDFVPGLTATQITPSERIVTAQDGTRFEYDKLVLATGSQVRRVNVPGFDSPGVHLLRTYDDALAITKKFLPGKRLVIVGGGFIGLEIAAAARTRELETYLIEATDRLLSRIVPQEIGDALANLHLHMGVNFRTGCMVRRVITARNGALRSIELSNGEIIPCDLAVIGVGVSPNSKLAAEAGLDVEIGITTNEYLQTSAPNIYAIGDVARFLHPLFGRHIRVEAWQNAEEHAKVAAANICGERAVCDTVPFFWSDQHDLSVQVVGIPHFGSHEVAFTTNDTRILYHLSPTGKLVGATGFGRAEKIGRYVQVARRLIAAGARPDREAMSSGIRRAE